PRAMPAALDVAKASSLEAWTRRLQSGPGGGSMVRFIGLMNTNDGGHLRRLAEWTDRIRAGELPASAPPRPHGVERNLVVTVYDWLSPKYYIHDLIVTDRRKPTVNPYGLIYGAAELSTDHLPVLDPIKITKTTMKVPIRDQDAPSSALANPVAEQQPPERVRHRRLGQHEDVLGDARRGEVAGLDAVDRRHQWQRQAGRLGRAECAGRSDEGQADRARSLRNRLQSRRRLHLGLEHRPSGLGHSHSARIESVRDRARRGVQGPAAGLRHARVRRRPPGKGMGDAGERSHRELRPANVQGTPQWPGRGGGEPLSRRLDLLSDLGPGVRRQGRRR